MKNADVHDLKKIQKDDSYKPANKSEQLISEKELDGLFEKPNNTDGKGNQADLISVTVYNYYLDEFAIPALRKAEKLCSDNPSLFKMEAKLVLDFVDNARILDAINAKGIKEKEEIFLQRFNHGYTYKVFGIAGECKELGISKFPAFVFSFPNNGKKVIISGREVNLIKVCSDLGIKIGNLKKIPHPADAE